MMTNEEHEARYYATLETCGLRYREMMLAARPTDRGPLGDVYNLGQEFIHGCRYRFPLPKLCRWLGYIQGVLVERGLTTVTAERNWTRPLFGPLDFPEED